MDRVFGAVDMDGSGRLHYMEFLAATVEARGYIEVLYSRSYSFAAAPVGVENTVTPRPSSRAKLKTVKQEIAASIPGGILFNHFVEASDSYLQNIYFTRVDTVGQC